MVVKFTFSGSTGGEFTNGNEYLLLGFDTGAVFLSDANKPRQINYTNLNGGDWTVSSITDVGSIQIYP